MRAWLSRTSPQRALTRTESHFASVPPVMAKRTPVLIPLLRPVANEKRDYMNPACRKFDSASADVREIVSLAAYACGSASLFLAQQCRGSARLQYRVKTGASLWRRGSA